MSFQGIDHIPLRMIASLWEISDFPSRDQLHTGHFLSVAHFRGFITIRGSNMNESYQKATFAAGCFWGIEVVYYRLNGVISTSVGYTGGQKKDPTYEDVCTGTTGHAEAVEVVFDPARISYKELLEAFWDIHDPTTLNRQGPDVGTQYRSAIFCHSAEQEAEAQASRDALQGSGRFVNDIVTEITPASEFYRAEEYHQRFLEKNSIHPCSCSMH